MAFDFLTVDIVFEMDTYETFAHTLLMRNYWADWIIITYNNGFLKKIL